MKLFDYTVDNGIYIIHFKTGIESSEVIDLKTEITALVTGNDVSGIVFDFTDVPFIDSSGVGLFVTLQRELETFINARFCNINPRIRQSFESMHLFKIFKVDSTQEESISILASAAL